MKAGQPGQILIEQVRFPYLLKSKSIRLGILNLYDVIELYRPRSLHESEN
jgi:hypothetical protein